MAIYGGGTPTEGLSPREDRLRRDLQLRDLAEQVREDLLNLDGISLVEMLAVRDYQIDVEIPEDTLRRHGLSLQQVGGLLRRENIELPAGEIKARSSEYLVRGKNKRETGVEIAELPLLSRPDGAVLRVRDLGTVTDGFTDDARRSWVTFPEPLADPSLAVGGADAPGIGGPTPAIVLMAQKTRSEDLLEIVGTVRGFVAELELPPGYRAAVFDDQSILVEERLDTLTTNALQGLALVFVTLALFLELRLAFWVAMGIPFAVAGAFMTMAGTDVTLNMVSTFAFLLALGIVVDDAIVVGENIYSHRERGKSPVRAAVDGAAEVSGPVLASVATTIFAFLPMFFVSGTLGKVIYVMPIVVCSMLLTSLGECILILPNHLSHRRGPILGAVGRAICWLLTPLFAWVWLVRAFRDRRAEVRAKGDENPVAAAYHGLRRGVDGGLRWFIDRVYEPVLRAALRVPLVFVAGAFAILIGSFGLVAGGLVPFIIFPEFDSNYITANVTFPAGTPSQVTDAETRRIADAIVELHGEIAGESGRPPIRTVVRSLGYAESAGGAGPGGRSSTTGSNIGYVFAEMVGGAERPISSFDLVKAWRERVGPVAGADEVKFAAGDMGPGGKPIEFQLVGRDMDDLEAVAERCKAHLGGFAGVFDVADDSKPGKPELQVRVKPEAEALGIDTNELAMTVRSTFYGEEVMRLQRGRHEVKLMVRYPPEQRDSLANLREIRVRTRDGEVPLEELAAVSVRRGYSTIHRIDQQRAITDHRRRRRGRRQRPRDHPAIAGGVPAGAPGRMPRRPRPLGGPGARDPGVVRQPRRRLRRRLLRHVRAPDGAVPLVSATLVHPRDRALRPRRGHLGPLRDGPPADPLQLLRPGGPGRRHRQRLDRPDRLHQRQRRRGDARPPGAPRGRQAAVPAGPADLVDDRRRAGAAPAGEVLAGSGADPDGDEPGVRPELRDPAGPAAGALHLRDLRRRARRDRQADHRGRPRRRPPPALDLGAGPGTRAGPRRSEGLNHHRDPPTGFAMKIRPIPTLLALALLAGCGEEGAAPGGGDGDAGRVVVYTALDQEFSEPILEDYEAETGTAVDAKYDVESTKTVGLTNKIIAERDRPRCDVFWNNELVNTLRLKQEGLLEPFIPEHADEIPATFKAADGTWYGFAGRARVLIVNDEIVPEADYPTSIRDMVDPKWKGKVGIAKPLFGTTATHAACLFEAWGDEEAKKYFNDLKANDVQILSGNKQVAQDVASGRLAFGLTDTDDAMAMIEQEGAPAVIVYPDRGDDELGTLFIPNAIAVIKGAPDPEAAEALASYLLSPEVEAALAEGPSAQIPLLTSTDASARVETPRTVHPMEVDFEAAAARWDEVAAFIREQFVAE